MAPLKDVNRFRMFPEFLVTYLDHALAITSVHGHIYQGSEGFYHRQTRFLSRMRFLINGQPAKFVSANSVDPYSFISYYLAPSPAGGKAGPQPDDLDDDGGEIADKAIEIQINRFVGGGMHQDVILTNHSLAPADCELTWELDADFADLQEALDGKRRQEAPVAREWTRQDGYGELSLRYMHKQLTHATLLSFPDCQGMAEYEGDRVIYRLTLQPRVPLKICIDVQVVFLGDRIEANYDCASFHSHDTLWDDKRDHWIGSLSVLNTPNATVKETWDRAVSDLGSLFLYEGSGDQVYTPAAGIPTYQALFGRDALTTAWQSSLLNPLMLKGTLQTVAKYLGEKIDDRFDEQPGRVIHQRQLSPLALLGLNPTLPYYGDYAGPGMFLVGMGYYFSQTGDRDFIKSMREPIFRVLEWMDRDGDRDGDGFYEYATRAGAWGMHNQGWKDSGQAILHEDGRMVDSPIAMVEIQGYYYAAKQLMGLVFLALGDVGLGTDLLKQAQDLKRRFNDAFWLPDLGFYALALDGNKRPVRSIASNVGHCLSCGIIDHDKALAVADRLMAPDMFSGWGVRTLSSAHPAFNPFAYHLGTVWPSENGSIALGCRPWPVVCSMRPRCSI
jgi:glycogen debranching enzyme